ncbi:MAG TPA: hypothetical protein VD971_04280 [Phycisphaerales bacterium]|nr:hypothetical protein [Phycisphaerales bacterium]
MHHRALRLFCVAGLGALAAAAEAGTKYRLAGDPAVHDAADGTVNVGTVVGLQTVTIYSEGNVEAGGSAADIPALTIVGGAGANAELRVLVAAANAPWPAGPEAEGLSPTGNDLGGLTFESPSLRDASRLVIAVNGRITGAVEAGQVFHVDARQGTTSDGDITAHASDGSGGFRAVEAVTSLFGSIQGDVVALNGSIGAVTAPAGSIERGEGVPPPDAPSIRARGGIERVIAHGSIYGDIAANDFGGGGDLRLVRAETGSITGSIAARTLLQLPGELYAIESEQESGAVMTFDEVDGNMRFGGGVPVQDKQIIVNGDWAGDIVSPSGVASIEIGGDVRGRAGCAGVGATWSTPYISRLYVGGVLGCQEGSTEAFAGIVLNVGEIRDLDVGELSAVSPFENFTTVRNGTVRGDITSTIEAAPLRLDIDGTLDVAGSVSSTVLSLHLGTPGTSKILIGDSLAGSVVFDPGALGGQVTIGARTGSGVWDAQAYPVATESFSLDSPTYSALPGLFGGGAVGLVPFAVHVPQTNNLNAGTFLTSRFNGQFSPACGARSAIVEFYGPVRIGDAGAPAAKVTGTVHDCFNQPQTVDLSFATSFTVDPANPRRLLVRAKQGYAYPSGTYTIEPAGTANLFCADVVGDVAVANFEVTFTLTADCDGDCVADAGTCGNTGLCDSIDFNNDGLFPDNQDLEDFQSVFGGGPCSTGDCNDLDFNNDGLFPDNADIEALYSVFGGGCAGCMP